MTALNCRIFRHGVGLTPHATDAQVLAWKKTKNGKAGLGCGAKLRWLEGKFVVFTGYDYRQRREARGGKNVMKKCLVC